MFESKGMTNICVIDNNCVKYYPDSTGSDGLLPGH